MGVYLYCIQRFSDVSARDFEKFLARFGLDAITSGELFILMDSVESGDTRISRDALMKHESVVQSAFELGPVIPFCFGTTATSRDEAEQQILDRNREQIEQLFHRIEGKIELSLKVSYLPEEIIGEILKSRPDIKAYSQRLKRNGKPTQNDRIEVGRMIAGALEDRKSSDGRILLEALIPLSEDYCLNPPINDMMILNAAFLVDTRREPEFDDAVERAHRSSSGIAEFKYVGPSVPYHFTSLDLSSSLDHS